jgi:anti-anti-sigma factor
MDLHVLGTADGVTRVALIGRLDAEGVDRVELRFSAAIASVRQPAVVDVSGLTFIASLGLGMLLRVAKVLDRCGSHLVLLNPQPLVHAVLDHTGMLGLLRVTHDEGEAIRLAQAE